METPEEAGAHLNTLHQAVWQLAAISLALRDPAIDKPDLRYAAGQVVAVGTKGNARYRVRCCLGFLAAGRLPQAQSKAHHREAFQTC